jgi:hypothetical protein
MPATQPSDFPRDFDAGPADDPAKSWRVIDASGTATDYERRRQARDAMYENRGSSALYLREAANGRWWLQETLLRED